MTRKDGKDYGDFNFSVFRKTREGRILHQLKNSLSAAIGYINLLKQRSSLDSEAREFVKNIELALRDSIEQSYLLSDILPETFKKLQLLERGEEFAEGTGSGDVNATPERDIKVSELSREDLTNLPDTKEIWPIKELDESSDVPIPTYPLEGIEFFISDEVKNPFELEWEESHEDLLTEEKYRQNTNYNFLIVEDDIAYGNLLKNFFDQFGYSVDFISDVEKAREKLKSKQYYVVLLDYELPGESGLELATEIRKKSPDTKLILLSGHPAELLREDPAVSQVQFDKIISKPIALRHLHSIIRNLILK